MITLKENTDSMANISMALRPYQQEVIDLAINQFKQSPDPIIIDACVGAGKTLIISHIARHVVKKGGRVISLAHSQELVAGAHKTFTRYAPDMECGIFSAGMGKKETEHEVTFCSEKSLVNSLDKFQPIDLLIIDEAHRVNDRSEKTCYMRIIKHFQDANPKLRVLGLTGTAFRTGTGKITGEKRLFKKVVASITVPELVDQGYLTQPIAPINQDAYDFNGVKKTAGKFKDSDLQESVSDVRLTQTIIDDIVLKSADRNKVLIFASTLRHAKEILGYLPKNEAGYLDGSLSKTDRESVLSDFSTGAIKYLVNRDILTTGYDETAIDAVCILRPTESRGLLIQIIGRGLRLHDGKNDVLILDYAENFIRHGSLDVIFTREMKDKKQGGGSGLKQCPSCDEWLNEMARNCHCGHQFIWRDCPSCGKKNDVTRRYCNSCDTELIDPNDKLTGAANDDGRKVLTVNSMTVSSYVKNKETLRVSFHTDEGIICKFIVPGSGYMKFFLSRALRCRGDRLDRFMQMPLSQLVNQEFSQPISIDVKPDGKFWNVTAINFSKQKPPEKIPFTAYLRERHPTVNALTKPEAQMLGIDFPLRAGWVERGSDIPVSILPKLREVREYAQNH
jgi:DNA repair protein RadD